MKMSEIKLTKHAKERYAERIMGKEAKSDIAVYVAQNEEKIENDIKKMIEFGDEIYFGVVRAGKKKTYVILNGTWIIIIDEDQRTVVTLYKIDFGLGEEFNKQFIDKMIEKLNAACSKKDSMIMYSMKKKNEYENIVSEYTEYISEYRNKIKNLETQINAYNDLIDSIDAEQMKANEVVRKVILDMTCQKEF